MINKTILHTSRGKEKNTSLFTYMANKCASFGAIFIMSQPVPEEDSGEGLLVPFNIQITLHEFFFGADAKISDYKNFNSQIKR